MGVSSPYALTGILYFILNITARTVLPGASRLSGSLQRDGLKHQRDS